MLWSFLRKQRAKVPRTVDRQALTRRIYAERSRYFKLWQDAWHGLLAFQRNFFFLVVVVVVVVVVVAVVVVVWLLSLLVVVDVVAVVDCSN